MMFKTIQRATMLLLLAAAPAQAALWPFAPHAQSDQQAPLSDRESDQIRKAHNQPVERIKLYQKFLEERIGKIKDIGPNPRTEDRRAELRARYEEFTRLADELQDYLDTSNAAHADIRKALKDLIPASEKWPDVLNRASVDQDSDSSRKTALEAAESTIDMARKLNESQKKYFAEHKDEAGKNGTSPS